MARHEHINVGPIFEGELSEFHLAKVLQSLAQARLTGVLHVNRDGIEKKIYLRNGFVVFAMSTLDADQLGNILLSKGIITAEQLAEAEGVVGDREDLPQLWEILIEQGVLDDRNIENYLRMQIMRIVYSLFYWQRGRFEFIEEQLTHDQIFVELIVGELIIGGIRSIKKPEIVEGMLPPRDYHLRKSQDPYIRYQKLRLNSEEKMVLEAITDVVTIGQVLELRNLQKANIDRILCGLIYSGLVEVSVRPGDDYAMEDAIGQELEEIIAFDLMATDDEASVQLRGSTADEGRSLDISQFFFPTYFASLIEGGKTGVLTCSRASIVKTVYFQGGKPVYATSDSPFEQLIPLLKLSGRLSEQQAQAALRSWEERREEWQGTILMEMGLLDFDDIEWPYQLQMKEIMVDLLGWDEGTAIYIECDLPDTPFVYTKLSPIEIIIEATKRHMQKPAIARRLPPMATVYRTVFDRIDTLGHIPLTAEEIEILGFVDGSRSLSSISSLVEMNDIELSSLFLIFEMLSFVEKNGEYQIEEPQFAKDTPESIAATDHSATDEHDELTTAVRGFYTVLDQENDPYMVLGLSRDCSPEQIELQYRAMVNKYHPDKTLAFTDDKLTSMAKRILQEIGDAYKILSDPRSRASYDRKHKASKETPMLDVLEDAWDTGETEADDMLATGNIKQALRSYQDLLPRTKRFAQICAKLALTMTFAEEYTEAKRLCRQAIERDPQNASLHAVMATICRLSGLMIVAQQAVSQSLKLDPHNVLALEEKQAISAKIKTIDTVQREKTISLALQLLAGE